MDSRAFVDLQGFTVDGDDSRHFIVKEAAVLRKGHILSHYTFAPVRPFRLLSLKERRRVCWSMMNQHGLNWDAADGDIPCGLAKSLITTAIIGRDARSRLLRQQQHAVVARVKDEQTQRWLTELLGRDSIITVDCMNVNFIVNDFAADTTIVHCDRHLIEHGHCALQIVYKMYNWIE